MILWMGFMIAVLTATGVYLTLSGSLFKLVVGFTLVGHAINLSVFALGGFPPLTSSDLRVSAIIDPGATTLSAQSMDPLPQALVLTAIVIGFGLQAFMAVLLFVLRRRYGIENTSALSEAQGVE